LSGCRVDRAILTLPQGSRGNRFRTKHLDARTANGRPACDCPQPKSLGGRSFRAKTVENPVAFGDTNESIAVAIDDRGSAKRFRFLGGLGRNPSAAQTLRIKRDQLLAIIFIAYYAYFPLAGSLSCLGNRLCGKNRALQAPACSAFTDRQSKDQVPLACASMVVASLTSNLPGPSTFRAATLPFLTSME
jgi:hypothetical protein